MNFCKRPIKKASIERRSRIDIELKEVIKSKNVLVKGYQINLITYLNTLVAAVEKVCEKDKLFFYIKNINIIIYSSLIL